MASTNWSSEFGSGLPVVTIHLDAPTYSGINTTNIVGVPHYQGMMVTITFDSDTGADIAMPTVLRQLKDVGAIQGSVHDSKTGASIH